MRKSGIWSLVVVAAALVTCSACTKHDVPSCSDEKVKRIVLDKARDIARDIIVSRSSTTIFKLTQVKGAYDVLKEQMGKENEAHRDEIRALLSAVDDKIAKVGIELTDVHLIKKHDESRMCECGGSLIFLNKETNQQNAATAEYTARFTEGRTLSVELTRF